MELNRIHGAEERYEAFKEEWNSPESQAELKRLADEHERAKHEYDDFLSGDKW